MERRSICVVLVSYFTGPVLFEAIESILSQDELDQFIIVDNGNPGTVARELADFAARDRRITLLTGHGNVG